MNKYEIIIKFDLNQFACYLEKDKTGEILELFDKDGIEILKNSNRKYEIIKYILAFSKYKNQLLQNIDFLDVILNDNINKYYNLFKNIDEETNEFIIKRVLELDKLVEYKVTFFMFLDEEFQIKSIGNKIFDKDFIICLLNKSYKVKVVQKVFDTYNINLMDDGINIYNLFHKCREFAIKKSSMYSNSKDVDIRVESYLITKDLVSYLWDKYDIFKLRNILNCGQYFTNMTIALKYVKTKEDDIIINATNTTLLYPFNEIYELFKMYKEQDNQAFNINKDLLKKIKNLCEDTNIKNLYQEIENIYLKNGINEVYKYIKKLSDEIISNYIVDYHFEENYYNIMLDMNELLQYYYDGNIVIDKDRLRLYEKLVRIDLLSNDDKINLHQELKKYDMMSMFYDDMRMARDMVAQTIKDYSLSSESIKEYRDEVLSLKYGVDVYKMDGNSFFGIVKTGRHDTNQYPTGHSYSIVGANGLAVFGDAKKSNTFLYDSSSLNIDQVVHVYPFDSFTMYKPFKGISDATRRVYTLMTPKELTNFSPSYNEILLLEQGYDQMQMDEFIPKLKSIALYCLDNITENDILVAKVNNVGIILIDTSKYVENENYKNERNGYFEYNYNYFDGLTQREYHDEIRRK